MEGKEMTYMIPYDDMKRIIPKYIIHRYATAFVRDLFGS